MPKATGDTLDQTRRDAGLSHGELFLRDFELGGMASALQVEAFCYGAFMPSNPGHDVVVHALNERFRELGQDHPIPTRTTPRQGRNPEWRHETIRPRA